MLRNELGQAYQRLRKIREPVERQAAIRGFIFGAIAALKSLQSGSDVDSLRGELRRMMSEAWWCEEDDA